MKFKDYYEIIGVSETASADEIKRAYRKKARQYHPDVSKEVDAEEKFKLVGEAYEVLRDENRRAEYDQLKKRGYRSGDEFNGGGNWQGQWQPGAGSASGAGDFSDFFNSIFGSASAAGGFGAGFGGAGGFAGNRGGAYSHAGAHQPVQGDTVNLRVRVSLERAYQGGKTTIKVPARSAQGSRSLSVTIPAGVIDGQQLRLRGQGHASTTGGAPGDLIITIELKKHRIFEVDGADILLQLPVTLLEAVEGVTLEVPTLGGEVSLKIPAGSKGGSKLRLRGRGLPAVAAGDQYVIVQIAVPADLSEHQRKLLQQFDASLDYDPRAHWHDSTVV